MEILERNGRRLDEGLDYEANDTHRQALMQGFELCKEIKTLNSAAAKKEEIRQEQDEEMLEGTEKPRFRNLVATLNSMSLDRSDVQYAEKKMCTKMVSGWKTVTRVMRAWKHDLMTVDVHVDVDARKSTSGGTTVNGTVANHWSRTQGSRS